MTEQKSNQFGTFGGVFTPSILTILGVIMFMRTGYLAGNAGVWSALLILVIAKSITLLTGLSISAISTNTEVKGGGAYYLISRSLGPEFGGSIGLALFLAQAFSVPFYILGFVEAMVQTFPQLEPYFLGLGMGTAILLFGVNYIGAGWAIRAQYFILGVLVVSIVTFFGGSIIDFDAEVFARNTAPGYLPGENFWTIFAVFFPAVTGIMAGVNMSGDLKEPEKSIPKGTLAAIAVGFVVYGAQIVVTAGASPREILIDQPYRSLMDHALFGFAPAVAAGVFAATLSSAIGSFMGAPRILQALARDEIFRPLKPFAFGTKQGDEPRNGLWLTFFLTLGVLWMAGDGGGGGALNAVASILTMFFLFTYGMTNVAAFIEKFSGNPSFRPRFKFFHWVVGLLGGIGCFGAALLINPVAAAAALVVVVGLFIYISRKVLETTFGDARRGFYYNRVRHSLRRLDSYPPHPKNWRPTTLVFTGNPATRTTLASYAHWFESGRGVMTLSQVIVGDVHDNYERRDDAWQQLQEYIEENGFNAFSEVMVAPTFDDGMASLMQGHSIGPLKPNLIMLGWPANPDRARPMARHMQLADELNMSQIILADRGLQEVSGAEKRIDVWWRGQENGSLMIILAYLLKSNWQWRGAELRLLRVVEHSGDLEAAESELVKLADAARIEATVEVVATDDFVGALHEHSAKSSVVFLGFSTPTPANAEKFHDRMTQLIEPLPTTLLIRSSGEADLSE